MRNDPHVVAVANSGDQLVTALAARLNGEGVRTFSIPPNRLGEHSVSLTAEHMLVDGRAIGGIIFRALPDSNFSDDFAELDRAFCDAEIGATWLAALNLASVFSVNRYDATAWFGGLGWPVWRSALMAAGVPVSPFAYGDVRSCRRQTWYPYATGVPDKLPARPARRALGAAITRSVPARTTLVAAGLALEGDALPTVREAADALWSCGVFLASVTTDHEGRVLCVDPAPVIRSEASLARAANLLSKQFHAHWHHR